MAQLLLVICLILADAFVVLSMAHSPSSEGKLGIAEAPANRKLGRHQPKVIKSFAAPCSSPYGSPQMEDKMHSTKEVNSWDQGSETVQGQEFHIKKQHHSMHKSVAGGGVILGGLATTFLVVVFCYIRATGGKNAEPGA